MMKKSFVLAALFALSACSLLSRNHGDDYGADQIVKLEHSWNNAIRTRDSAALDKLLAPDFILAADGRTHGAVHRSTWLSATMRPVAFDTLGSDNIRVSVRGDTATATLRTFWRARISGQHVSAASRVSDLWVKRQGRWQVRSRRVIKQETAPRLASGGGDD
jgi:ketosteroid isomerase-like protein